jgi:hypothetical protein
MFQGDSPVARLWTSEAAMGSPREHGVIEDLVILGRILWLPPGLTLPDGAVRMRRPLDHWNCCQQRCQVPEKPEGESIDRLPRVEKKLVVPMTEIENSQP